VFADGRAGSVVLVGSRNNAKGAVVIMPADNGGAVKTIPLAEALDAFHPATVVDIVAMQERAFGNSGLQPV